MPKPACSDEDFIGLFTQFGAAQTARKLEINVRGVLGRRRRLEKKYDKPIYSPATVPTEYHPNRQTMDIENGVVLVCVTAH